MIKNEVQEIWSDLLSCLKNTDKIKSELSYALSFMRQGCRDFYYGLTHLLTLVFALIFLVAIILTFPIHIPLLLRSRRKNAKRMAEERKRLARSFGPVSEKNQ
ncbi:hypothetical protein [Acinetobacter colistiniresistens]|uniref:hypothetical protein n=1 Tax=Acinetobacter colistiniresistens TaxID=280145 RepID=UPI001250CE6D|nr:hypothetical protein [Acinetobacter colistiniresistens]